jgi:hypothetical protein
MKITVLQPFAKLVLVGLLNSGPLTALAMQRDYRGRFFYHLLYIAAHGNNNFTFHLLFPSFKPLTLAPLLLRSLSFGFLLTWAMEEERSPVLDIVGDESGASHPKASRSEASAMNYSSWDTSSGRSENGIVVEGEDNGAMDPCESAQSYDFSASIITVGRIRRLEVLGYCVEGSAREPGEEVVLDPTDDEAVVFEEFFPWGSGCYHSRPLLISWLSFECSSIN